MGSLHSGCSRALSHLWCTWLVLELSCRSTLVRADNSRLRVATCFPVDLPPYVEHRNGTIDDVILTGFEVELWNHVFLEMSSAASRANSSHLLELVGTEQPQLISMQLEEMIDSLANSTIDIGFCGIYQKPDLEKLFDFGPVHLVSGLQAIVRYSSQPTIRSLISSLWVSMGDVYAQASLLILIYFALVFGHIVWAIERETNGPFDKHYGPGIVDSLWFALVTAFTVGYGDKCVSSLAGRLVTIVWMVLGAYFCGIFTAALTSAFVQNKLSVTSSDIEITSTEDLEALASVIAVSTSMWMRERQGVLSRVRTVEFASEAEVARSLLEDDAQDPVRVAVVDARSAHYLTRISPEFRGTVITSGPILADEQVAFAVARKDGLRHPVYPLLSDAVVKHMRGRARRVYESELVKWFGTAADDQAFVEQPAADDYDRKLRDGNQNAAILLIVLLAIWAVAVGVHYRNEIREEMIRQRFLKALAVGKKYGLNELREGASKMFRRTDKDKSGGLDITEITALLNRLGKDIALADIHRYMRSSADNAEPNEGGGFKNSVASSVTSSIAGLTTTRWMGMGKVREAARAEDSGGGQGAAVLIREPEFIKIIEGIVLDETVEEQDHEDLNVAPQRRHLLKSAADVQTQVQELDTYVTKQVTAVEGELAALSSKVEMLIKALAPGDDRLAALPAHLAFAQHAADAPVGDRGGQNPEVEPEIRPALHSTSKQLPGLIPVTEVRMTADEVTLSDVTGETPRQPALASLPESSELVSLPGQTAPDGR